MTDTADNRYVLNVLTGFLGSGKTSLLRRLLSSPAFSRAAVLVNELGEIPLDHELLERLDEETVVLRSGCVCCGVRSDLASALLQLNERRDRGDVPPFDRVVVETTGLADPVPVINTVIADPALRHHFRVGTIVTTVDAVLGESQLERRPEARKQAAVADRIVMTKADIADTEAIESLRCSLLALNPHASIIESHNDAGEAQVLMASDLTSDHRDAEVRGWFSAELGAASDSPATGLFSGKSVGLSPMHGGVQTCSLVIDEPLDWTALGVWLSMLLHRHGASILRVKGMLNLDGVEVPTIVHGVQHLLHPPVHLSRWPSDDRRSRLVLIGDLPDPETLRASLLAFNRAGRAG